MDTRKNHTLKRKNWKSRFGQKHDTSENNCTVMNEKQNNNIKLQSHFLLEKERGNLLFYLRGRKLHFPLSDRTEYCRDRRLRARARVRYSQDPTLGGPSSLLSEELIPTSNTFPYSELPLILSPYSICIYW